MMTDPVGYENEQYSKEVSQQTFSEVFQSVSQQNYTGLLTVTVPGHSSWKFFLSLGRIIWVSGGNHRLRRWYRLLGPDLREMAMASLEDLNPQIPYAFQFWEYLTLAALIRRQKIDRDRAVEIVQRASLEVLFEISQAQANSGSMTYVKDPKITISDPFKWLNVDGLLAEVHQQWRSWKTAALAHYSPNQAPILHHPEPLQSKVSPKTYEGLCRLLKGHLSLRELAVLLNQSEQVLTQSLVGYEQQGLIQFITILDAPLPQALGEFLDRSRSTQSIGSASPQPVSSQFASPKPASPQQQTATPHLGPLVMCIDDNPLVCQQMAKIITEGGYRYESVQDSVQALQSVIELQPSLIFLDLVMSVISGYELCAQIRRIQKFRNTAIVILTSNDGVLDRVRTKMVGATEFVCKPIKPEVIQEMVSKYSPPPHAQPIIFYPD